MDRMWMDIDSHPQNIVGDNKKMNYWLKGFFFM